MAKAVIGPSLRRWFDRSGALLYGLGVALVAGLVLALVFTQWSERDNIRDQSLGKASQLAQLLADNTAGSVQGINAVLELLGAELVHDGWHDWSVAEGIARLDEIRSRYPLRQLRGLMVFDAAGDQKFSVGVDSAKHRSAVERPYFQAHRQGAASWVYGPFVGRQMGGHVFTVSRRLDDAMGRFDGIVVAAFEPSYFESFCRLRPFDRTVEAALVNADGRVVGACAPGFDGGRAAGQPAEQVLAGGRLAGLLPKGREGVWLLAGEVVAAAAVGGPGGLAVIVATPLDEALSDWRIEILANAAMAALALATLLLGAGIIRSQGAQPQGVVGRARAQGARADRTAAPPAHLPGWCCACR